MHRLRNIVIPALQSMPDMEKLDTVRDALHNHEQLPSAETFATLTEVIRTFVNHKEALMTVLEGRNLGKLDLSGCKITVPFARALLESANLEAASVYRTSFSRALLTESNLQSARFDNVTFVGAALVGVNMRSARFNQCQFDGAQLCGSDLRGTFFHHCTFKMSDLTKVECDAVTTFDTPYDWAMAYRKDMKGRPRVTTGAK